MLKIVNTDDTPRLDAVAVKAGWTNRVPLIVGFAFLIRKRSAAVAVFSTSL